MLAGKSVSVIKGNEGMRVEVITTFDPAGLHQADIDFWVHALSMIK